MFDGLKSVFRQKDFIWLMVIFFIGLGVFNAVSTWIENIIRPRGFSIGQAGVLGGLMVTGGIVGAAILPIFSDRAHQRKPFITLALVGAGLGFLWFNAYPAQIFMGDTGSLALGGAIGTAALVVKKEALLILVGGVFVIEALSVLIQIYVFRTRKRRFFLIAPIHHHYEMKGYHEVKVTVRFWIMAIIFALISLASLKLQ